MCSDPNYYNERYIWPVGFRSSRQYSSYKDVDGRVDYVSEILDGGPMGPIFKVWTERVSWCVAFFCALVVQAVGLRVVWWCVMYTGC